MIIKKFSLTRKYEIKCKAFIPEDKLITSVIIGVHGFAGDKESSMLTKLAEAVVEEGTALVCFDFPAHGESPVDESELTVENCKRDLIFVADFVRQAYPNAKKHIFATSFGGYISLLCYDFLMDYDYILRAPAITMPDLLLQNVLKVSEQEFKTRGFMDCGYERPIRLPYSFYEELRLQEDLLCKQYMKPVHIFHGDKDDIVPLDVILDFVSNNQNANLILVKGADHRFKNEGEIESIIDKTKQILRV